MAHITDPSFELDSPAWNWQDGGSRSQSINAHDGEWTGRLGAFWNDLIGAAVNQAVAQTINVEAGIPIPLSFWVWGPWPEVGILSLTAHETLTTTQLMSQRLTSAAAGSGWYHWSPGSIISSEPQVLIRIQASWVSPDNVTWYIDDFLDEPLLDLKGKYAALQALQQRLKLINGNGYHNDIGGRVYTKLITPMDERVPMPYLCIPLIGPDSNFVTVNQHVQQTWLQKIYGYVAEPGRGLVGTEAEQRLDLLERDVTSVLMGDWSIKGTVNRDSTILGANSWTEGDWGEMQMDLGLSLRIARDSIGP